MSEFDLELVLMCLKYAGTFVYSNLLQILYLERKIVQNSNIVKILFFNQILITHTFQPTETRWGC